MDTETLPGVEVLRLDGPLYFANAGQVAEQLESIATRNAMQCRKAMAAAAEALRGTGAGVRNGDGESGSGSGEGHGHGHGNKDGNGIGGEHRGDGGTDGQPPVR